MFPRSERLGSSRSVVAVMRRGAVKRRGAITIFSTSFPGRRVAVVVDKKVSKKAVIRNLVRRRLQHILFERVPENTHLVLRAFPGIETQTYQQLAQVVTQCLENQVLPPR